MYWASTIPPSPVAMETIRPDPRSLSLPIASLLHTNSTLGDRANRNTKQKKGGKKPFPVSFSARPPPESMEIRAPPTSLRLAPPPASASFRRAALRTSFLNGSGAFPEFVSYPASPSYPCSREMLLHEFFLLLLLQIRLARTNVHLVVWGMLGR